MRSRSQDCCVRAPTGRHVRCLLFILGAIAAVCVTTTPPGQAAGKSVTVPQGDVGRWSGEGTQRCGMDGRAWEPLDGTCWYPVDLEREPGRVEIARWLDGGHLGVRWRRARIDPEALLRDPNQAPAVAD